MILLVDAGGTVVSEVAKRLVISGARVRVLLTPFSRCNYLVHEQLDLVSVSLFEAEELTQHFMTAQVVILSAPTSPKIIGLPQVQEEVAQVLYSACLKSEIRSVLHISRFGAHLNSGTGPIHGCFLLEQFLNQLPSCQVKHVRGAYFLENFLRSIPILRTFGVISDLLHPDIPFFCITVETFVSVIVREALNQWMGCEKTVLHVREEDLLRPLELSARIGSRLGLGTVEYVQSDHSVARGLMHTKGITSITAMDIITMYQSFYTATFVTEVITGPTEVFPSALDSFLSLFVEKYNLIH
jgi:hypothetical protein